MTNFDDLKRLSDHFTNYPAFQGAIASITEKIHLYEATGLVQNLMLLGESGTGKTSICKKFLNDYPRYMEPERDVIPVLHVTVPAAATVGSLCGAIFTQIHPNVYQRGTNSHKTARAIEYIRACGVKLFLLDESHHLVDRGQERNHYAVGDWLKVFIDEIKIPVVLVGLPRAKKLKEVNDQLRRRLDDEIFLGVGQAQSNAQTECLRIFRSFQPVLSLPLSTDGEDLAEFANRLLFATNGRIAYFKRLLEGAVLSEAKENGAVIDRSVLERAFRAKIWPQVSDELNPFSDEFVFRELSKAGEPFSLNGSVVFRRQTGGGST